MNGRQTVSLFAPIDVGFEVLVLRGVHWQEESMAHGVVARLFAPVEGGYEEELAAAAGLSGALLAAEGEHQSPDGVPCWALQHAVRHGAGPGGLRHWEFVFT